MFGAITASIPISLTMYEGHAGLFYRSFGLQVGVVRSNLKSNGDFLRLTDGESVIDIPALAPFDVQTTDWTCYAVYRKSSKRWGGSIGLGAYAKQGITDAPLRFQETKTVGSGFLTANVVLGRHISVDGSYWYVGDTNEVATFESITSTPPSDAQGRVTLGLGYSF